jgi:hypothetical protein
MGATDSYNIGQIHTFFNVVCASMIYPTNPAGAKYNIINNFYDHLDENLVPMRPGNSMI